jgi:hypothetical protein
MSKMGLLNIQPLVIDSTSAPVISPSKRTQGEMTGADRPCSSGRKLKRHTSEPIFCPHMSLILAPKAFPMRRSSSENQFDIAEDSFSWSPRQYGGLGGCDQLSSGILKKSSIIKMKRSASAPCLRKLLHTSRANPLPLPLHCSPFSSCRPIKIGRRLG